MADNIPTVQAVILIVEGPLSGEKFILQQEQYTLGTAGQLLIKDQSVAPVHALFYRKKNRYYLRRMNDAFPLVLNGQEIEDEVLTSMDEIVLGKTKMIYALRDHFRAEQIYQPGGLSREEITTDRLRGADSEVIINQEEFTTRRMGTDLPEQDEDHKNQTGPLHTRLDILSGGGPKRYFEVQLTRIVIGRTNGDVLLDDPDISRKHCSIEVQGLNRIFLHDNASTNGTFLNGNRISYSLLKSGDVIQIGNTKFKVTFTSL